MSLEREIKETLMDTADKVRPGDPSFEQVETQIKRRRARAVALISASLVTVLIAGAIAVPALLDAQRDPAPTFANHGEPTTEPSTGVYERTAVAEPMSWYRNERDAYQTSFPPDWKTGEFEGAVEFNPKGLPGLPLGEDTFAVEIQHRIGENYENGEPGIMFQGGHEVGGRAAVRARFTRGEEHQIVYRVDWTGAGCPPTADCDAEVATLRVMIFASTDALWEQYVRMGEGIARGLRTTPLAHKPGGGVHTRRGYIEDGVEYDEFTGILVRFLDDRMEGEGRQYLSDEAERAYDAPDARVGVGLHEDGDPPRPWISFKVLHDAQPDAASREFIIELTTGGEDAFVQTEGLALNKRPRGIQVTSSRLVLSPQRAE